MRLITATELSTPSVLQEYIVNHDRNSLAIQHGHTIFIKAYIFTHYSIHTEPVLWTICTV